MTAAPGPATSTDKPSEQQLRLKPTGTFRGVLTNGPFLRLWLAQAGSQTANSMVDFSLLLRVGEVVDYHHIAQANTAVSFVILAFSLPSLVFGPIAGAIADRVDRRNLMALVNAIRAALVMLFILVRPEWPPQFSLGAIYATAFLFGAAGQFFMPAQGAAIPQLVPREQLTAANGLFNLTFTATQLLGFAILGPLLSQAFGVDRLFIGTMATFAVATLLTMTLPPLPVPVRVALQEAIHPVRRVWEEVREGLDYIRQDPLLMRAITYLTVATTTFMLVAALAPQFITTVIELSPGEIGYLVAPAGIGVIIGVALAPMLSQRFNRSMLVDWSFLVGGVALFLLATSREILTAILAPEPVSQRMMIGVAGVLAAVLGIANALVLVPSQTVLQERSHEHIRARVYATFFTVTSVASFVPIFFAAAAADIFGVVAVLAAVAFGLILLGAVSLVLTIRRLRERQARLLARRQERMRTSQPAK
ncbi:MAG: MFS transporter [Thermomicrobiales bacterium]